MSSSSEKINGLELMKEASPLGRLASMIVWVAPNPESVVFHILEWMGKTMVQIYVPPEERGRVIGNNGSTIRSIRTIFFSSLARDDPEFDISLLEEEGGRRRRDNAKLSKDRSEGDE